MWRRFSPYNQVKPDNPVFQQEQRHLRWLKTSESLLNYNRFVWMGIPALIFFWWLIERTNWRFGSIPPDLENHLPLFLLVVSAGVMILSSFYIVITTIGRIHKQFHAGDWQTLRITTQSESDILDAKDAIAQIQAWPFIALEIGLRGAFVAIFTVNSFYDLYQRSADKSLYFQGLLSLGNCLGWTFILLIGVAFVLEPWLRMRVLIAWSTIIALQIKSVSLALLTGFGAALLFHLTQAGLIGMLGSELNEIGKSGDGAIVGIICIFIPLCVFAAAAFYGFYIGIRRMTNNFIRRKAFAPD